jgi:hypothetical protein
MVLKLSSFVLDSTGCWRTTAVIKYWLVSTNKKAWPLMNSTSSVRHTYIWSVSSCKINLCVWKMCITRLERYTLQSTLTFQMCSSCHIIPTEVFHDFPQYLLANAARIVPQIRPWPLPSTSLPIHHSLSSFRSTVHSLSCWEGVVK